MDTRAGRALSRGLSRSWPGALAALLLSLFSLAGCVGEDRDDCPPPGPGFNVALAFSLENGVDRFLDKIHSVDVFILDSVGGFLRRERVERDSLEVYQGLRLHLDPGRYRVTCWGNNAANTAYEGLLPGVTTGGIAYSAINTLFVGDSDSLYRAPSAATTRATRATRAPALTGAEPTVDGLLTLEVPKTGADVTLPVEFSTAYHLVEVRVIGYDGGNSLPNIEIAGLPIGDELLSGLSLLDASLSPRRVTGRKPAVDDGTNSMTATATFTTFLFPLDDPAVLIRVLDPVTGLDAPHTPVVLSSKIDPGSSPSTSITIHITIDFTTLYVDVTVTVEGWDSNPVYPV
jgi:hypothetical protein